VGPHLTVDRVLCTYYETVPFVNVIDKRRPASRLACRSPELPTLQRQSRRNDCFAPLLRALLSSPGDGSVGPNPTFCRLPSFPLA
jgi:hypothetical protein